jgi:hypothetical protein
VLPGVAACCCLLPKRFHLWTLRVAACCFLLLPVAACCVLQTARKRHALDDHRPFCRIRRRRLTGSQPRENPRNAREFAICHGQADTPAVSCDHVGAAHGSFATVSLAESTPSLGNLRSGSGTIGSRVARRRRGGAYRSCRVLPSSTPNPSPAADAHATIHVVVENQVALGEAVVIDALARLRADGLTRLDAVHAVGTVLAGHTSTRSSSRRRPRCRTPTRAISTVCGSSPRPSGFGLWVGRGQGCERGKSTGKLAESES